MAPTLTRRELFILMSYAGLEVTGTFSSTAFGSEKELRKAFRRLAKRSEMEPLKKTGRLYLETTPKEGDVTVLLQLLPDAESVDESYWAAFADRMRADFATGETVSLNGWVLARSECRLYGLLHLIAS